jgi:hypothetical protein
VWRKFLRTAPYFNIAAYFDNSQRIRLISIYLIYNKDYQSHPSKYLPGNVIRANVFRAKVFRANVIEPFFLFHRIGEITILGVIFKQRLLSLSFGKRYNRYFLW